MTWQTGEWHDLEELLATVRGHEYAENLETRHVNVPFYITWYFDPFLKKVPDLVKQWETGQQLKPVFVVLGEFTRLIVFSHLW